MTDLRDNIEEGSKQVTQTKFALYGVLLTIAGGFMYILGVLLGPIRQLVGNPEWLLDINSILVWYSGIPMLVGFLFIASDFIFIVGKKRKNKYVRYDEVDDEKITVVLTAYNDELSIAEAVEDFSKHPKVERVIVVSNNSSDKTYEVAEAAGAIVFNEEGQGYGACVHRSLSEAIKFDDSSLVLLCEGDCTFRSYDIDKFLSYIHHADIVNGTRIVEQLQDNYTQLSVFMHYGNFFVGKLLEMKYLGDVTLSDVGTTYKMCRKSVLEELLPTLDPKVNLEFNPYFLDKAILQGYEVMECPITFHPRVGVSKGGNINNTVALKLGLNMIVGIITNWKNVTKS
jgi:glycosyltransferase involved in cell wall biosynthesis